MQTSFSHRRAYQAGLTLRDSAVLEALIEIAQPEDGQLTVAASKYELAKMLGMSPDAVQRALTALRDKSLVARKQSARVAGCVALTTLLPQALGLFGLADEHAPAIPACLAQCLIAQSSDVIHAVARAYHARELPAPSTQSAFCGTSEHWSRIEAILRARLPVEDLLTAVAHSDIPMPTVEVPLADGSVGRIDLAALTQQCPLPLDAAFLARAVIAVVAIVQPRDARALARLTAEIAYSRCAGFVRDHGPDHGVNVLRRVMTRGGWTTPRRMSADWYALAERACLSTDSAPRVH